MSNFNAQAWDTADVDSGNKAPEPGIYEVLIEDAAAFTSKSGNDIVTLDLKVATGPDKGYQWTELRGFKNEGSIAATKATCARLGVDVASIANLAELDSALKAVAVGEWYAIEVKQNGEYLNVYFNSKVGQPVGSDVPTDPSEFAVSPASPGPDGVPF